MKRLSLNLPFAGVVAGVVVGLLITVARHPVQGCSVMALSFVAAGLMRSTLPPRQLGLLVNRGKVFDSVVLATIGLVTLGLIVSLRNTYS